MKLIIQGLEDQKIILASSSPRRKELLEQIGLKFKVVPSSIEESIQPGETPLEFAQRMAREKAHAVGKNSNDALIISADTIVLLDDHVLGKPAVKEKAYKMLTQLSGREHKVITAFYILNTSTDQSISEHVETSVTFKELCEDEILAYIKTGEPYDKAGGYAIQGIGSFMIKEIKGSYTNVVGLPICELIEVLKRINTK